MLFAPLAGSPKFHKYAVAGEQVEPVEPKVVVLLKHIFCPAHPGFGKATNDAIGLILTWIFPAVYGVVSQAFITCNVAVKVACGQDVNM